MLHCPTSTQQTVGSPSTPKAALGDKEKAEEELKTRMSENLAQHRERNILLTKQAVAAGKSMYQVIERISSPLRSPSNVNPPRCFLQVFRTSCALAKLAGR